MKNEVVPMPSPEFSPCQVAFRAMGGALVGRQSVSGRDE